MRANNKQKIKVLESILQQIVDLSTIITDYDIEILENNDELLVNVALNNEDGVVVWEREGTYFEVYCECELVLYPLI